MTWQLQNRAVVSPEPGNTPHVQFADPRFRLAFARLCAHYFSPGAWLAERQLLRDAHLLAQIPAPVLIHGRLDLGGPLATAWELARAWHGGELVVLDGAGHTSADLGGRVVAATDRFAHRN